MTTVLHINYKLLFNQEFYIDTKIKDAETILISIMSEIFDKFKELDKYQVIDFFDQMNKVFIHKPLLYSKLPLTEYKYIQDEKEEIFYFNNYSKDFTDKIINTCLLKYLSKLPFLPYLNDIEGYEKIIEIDFDYYIIYYNFEISEDTQNAINNFNQYFNEFDESLNFEIRKTKLDKEQIMETITRKENPQRKVKITQEPKKVSLENEIFEMRSEIKELKNTIKELVEMMKAVYEFEDVA